MAAVDNRYFGPTTLTTAASVGATVAANTSQVITVLLFSSPTGTAANTARVSVGADATATRSIEIPIPAGPQTTSFYPNLVLAAGEHAEFSVQAGTGIICTADGYKNQI